MLTLHHRRGMDDFGAGSDFVLSFVDDSLVVLVGAMVNRCPFPLFLSFVLVVEKLVAKLVQLVFEFSPAQLELFDLHLLALGLGESQEARATLLVLEGGLR